MHLVNNSTDHFAGTEGHLIEFIGGFNKARSREPL